MKKIRSTSYRRHRINTISCADKKETHKEINIEKKKINDSLVRATVTTKYTKGEEVNEEVQIIEGTPGEVNSQLDAYKKETLMEVGEQAYVAHDIKKEVQTIKT